MSVALLEVLSLVAIAAGVAITFGLGLGLVAAGVAGLVVARAVVGGDQ